MFSLTSTIDSSSIFSPRTAELLLRTGKPKISTPGILTCTSRGIVPHLSNDNVKRTRAIRWVHVSFESFLEHSPPIPTLLQPQHGDKPRLNSFLGLDENDYLLSMSLRDPSDGREMPANTNTYVTANCIRGVRRVTPHDWQEYVRSLKPDIAFSLSDIPFTPPSYSQKRITKSIERSALWLQGLLGALSASSPMLFVQMAGGASIPARKAFSDSLLEVVHGKDADAIHPMKSLDEGVAGYVFDLVPLRLALAPDESICTLLQASLRPLPRTKPRLVTSACGPHEMLRLIRDVGVDLFDTQWAQRAADVGVALDFGFPVAIAGGQQQLHDLGYNLYDDKYRRDFTSLGIGCTCPSCSPYSIPADEIIRHSSIDAPSTTLAGAHQPYTKAYLHHLLHTHEMSAHTLLVMHNMTVMERFFEGVRDVIGGAGGSKDDFVMHVSKFIETYAEDDSESNSNPEGNVLAAARKAWREVELLRGKGRLSREAEKTNQANEMLVKEMDEKGAEGGVLD
ncbi:tRNA-guanine transglycosylase [Gymnopus androsaceus JB14]|uniref:tRNA-guanine transglycosylase n=1 Tax=Gymnopus androsaceus JB14 TaxID=1447944 RepID=A0A6A4IE68_9AGAR|nr:tRNA-guanine transglycosylase [Gymnopus androsaceus JB14]